MKLGKLLPVLILIVLSAVACGGNTEQPGDSGEPSPTFASPTATPTRDEEQAACSAGQLSEDIPEPPGLPAPVAMMRKEILKAAVNCDYDTLQALALRPDGSFQYSNEEESAGAEAQPGRYWREQEAAGEQPLRAMVEILSGAPEVRGVEENEGPGTGSDARYFTWPTTPDPANYRGYRTTITSDGDWTFFLKTS